MAAVSTSINHPTLIIPGRQKGHLQIIDLNSLGYYISVGESDNNNTSLPPLLTSDSSNSTTTLNNTNGNNGNNTRASINVSIIAAHSGRLSCISLNHDGSRCATTSDKGTLIRVFNTVTGVLLHELRRGVDRAEI